MAGMALAISTRRRPRADDESGLQSRGFKGGVAFITIP
jgi:hypothetical protein